MSLKKTLGIMDWGIGGLSVYRALRSSGNKSDVIYFSDSGYLPYGRATKRELRDRFSAIGDYLSRMGVDQILVACNAASSALDKDFESFGGANFMSIVPAATKAVVAASGNRIGVIGGELTIRSGIYQSRFQNIDKEFKYSPAQPLSALVEAGDLSSESALKAVQSVMGALGKIDSLLLACTHYPALGPLFDQVQPGIELLDPAAEMISGISDLGTARFKFLTTGELASSKIAAAKAFNVIIESGESVGDLLGYKSGSDL